MVTKDLEIFKEVIECSVKVWEYAIENLSIDTLNDGRLNIDVPSSVHQLLEARFNENIKPEIREYIWEVLYPVLVDNYESRGYARRINENLCSALNRNADGQAMEAVLCDIWDADSSLEWNDEPLQIETGNETKIFNDLVGFDVAAPHISIELKLDKPSSLIV